MNPVPPCAPGPRPSLRRSVLAVLPIAAAALVVLTARASFADHYYIPSGSMEPTLREGDRVLVWKATYGLRVPLTQRVLVGQHLPERGDVVVFVSPRDGETLIKRVLGLPGDLIEVRAGVVRLDGVPLGVAQEREQLRSGRSHAVRLGDGGPDLPPIRVPQDHLLVLGDNRANSADSRVWGFLPVQNLRGRAAAACRLDEPDCFWL